MDDVRRRTRRRPAGRAAGLGGVLRAVWRALAGAIAIAAAGTPIPARSAVPDATVALPPDPGIRGYPLWDSWYDLGDVGYTEQEYFVTGLARSHAVLPAFAAPYTTRIIVTRPIDPADFNGTVMLDWVNVTAQFENAVDTLEAHEMLLREGWAYVHVSAQAAGVCCTPLTPKVWDPVRYASLSHPGDDYAFDIFSQVAKAIRAPAGLDPMGSDLDVQRVIAAGQSQSASRLATYVRQVQPDAGVIDGFLIHGGGSKVFATPPEVPVLHLLSDLEASPEQPNTDQNYRLWEIAGAAHSDFWIGYHQVVGQGPRFAGTPKQPASAEEGLHAAAGNYGERPHPLHAACIVAGGAFPMRYATSAALVRLDEWVRTGIAPPSGPRYAFAAGALARDADGNALGGIRLPPVVAPVARYVSTSCGLGGITIPFIEPELWQRYPRFGDYYCDVVRAAEASVADGFLLEPDAEDLLERARGIKDRWLEDAGVLCV